MLADDTFHPDALDCDAPVRIGGVPLFAQWRGGTANTVFAADAVGDCAGPGDTPCVHPDDATALLAAELRYRAALRERRDVTGALHELQRIRVALGLHAHLP